MMAGRMKLNNFLMLVAGALFVAILGAAALLVLAPAKKPEALPTTPPPPVVVASPDGGTVVTPPVAVPDAPATSTAGTPSRPADQAAFGYIGKDLGTDKLKDVTSGQPYKVNVYQDAGNTTANRAKIDLDRDDKWDEKLTFKPGEISREVAPADDEKYTEKYLWQGNDWVRVP